MKRLYEYGQRVLPSEKDFRKIPAVCLIDEIDTYLHPEWQHLILKGLTEQFPNVYFIVTSHSPYILASIPEKELKIYEIQTNDSEPRTIENLYGADINRATEAMHVPVRLKELADSIEKVYRLIESNNLTGAKAEFNKHLTDIDSNEDSDIQRIIRMIQNREKLNSEKATVS